MPRKICKLCLQEKDLVRSHLLPARLYKYCRQGEHRPIKLGNGVILPTDRELQDHLLCKSCEDLLSAAGETWVNPKLATWDRTFPLYDLLNQKPPDCHGDDITIYFARRNPAIEVEQLEHFALGIFWKASVHSWRGTSRQPLIQLGPYSDAIRKWLKGESDFPRHVYLRVVIATPPAAQIVLVAPYETPRDAWHHFVLHVPGLLFLLDVGKQVDKAERAISISYDPQQPIFVYDAMMKAVAGYLARETQGSRRTKAYLRAVEKVRAYKSSAAPGSRS